MISKFEHIVDTSSVFKEYIRKPISSSVRLLSLSDLIDHENEFITTLSKSFKPLPYDYYDVAFKIENTVKNFSNQLFEKYHDEWMQVWDQIGHKPHIDLILSEFWSDKISDHKTLSIIKCFRPHRKRSCYSYTSCASATKKDEWIITEQGVPLFSQNVSDSRSRVRKFCAPDMDIVKNEGILKLIACISDTLKLNPCVPFDKFQFTFHQMQTFASEGSVSKPAPEGIHQDGAAFIVSAIVIEKVNVTGGVSRVYHAKPGSETDLSKLALEHELLPGQGIMQPDEFDNYWHGVTPIKRINKNEIGYRSIIGFDIEFMENEQQL